MSAADLTDEDMQFLIQRLRALGLVRLTRHTQGQRLPPTRGVEPTDRGLEILQRTAA
jgi:hypothetical protein